MKIITHKINLATKGRGEMLDLTPEVRHILKESSFMEGQVLLFAKGSTAALTTIEYESGLLEDLKRFINSLLPADKDYQHNMRWHDGNGHSHLRASLFQPHLTIPFYNGELLLGTWQQILFLEFDNKPHQREIIIQVIGE